MTTESHADLGNEIASLSARLSKLIADVQVVAARHKTATRLSSFAQRLTEAQRTLDGGDKPLDESQVDWLTFAAVLKRHRKAAGLGQKELGARIGVSTSYVRAFESGTRRPTVRVLMRLLSVQALGISLDDLAPRTAGVHPSIWLAPEYDPRELLADLCERLSGSGCSLEQTYAYLDTQCASDYLALTNQASYQVDEAEKIKPIDQLARLIASSVRTEWLDLVALGCGDARRECSLVQAIQKQANGRFKIRLLLLDISHALLTEGYKHACSVLRDVTIIALQGSFHELPQYPILVGDQRARVLTMFGNTLANLDNELRFFRDTLAGASLGDYFLLDYTQALGSSERADEIRLADPAVVEVRESHRKWLTGIFQRYCKGMRSVDISIELNTDCVVRGSYELAYVAKVDVGELSPPKRFVVLRIRRYDGEQLQHSLGRTGWSIVKRLKFGVKGSNHLHFMLLRRELQSDLRRTDYLPAADSLTH